MHKTAGDIIRAPIAKLIINVIMWIMASRRVNIAYMNVDKADLHVV